MARTAAVQVEETPILRPKRGQFDYSKAKQEFQSSRSARFFEFLRGYPRKDGLSIFVYRLLPKIDNRLIGKESNDIDITADIENVSRDWVISRHGGGKYMLKLSDANAKDNKDRAVTYIDASGPDDPPPKLDLRTLILSHHENVGYIESLLAQGALVRDEHGRARLKTEQTTNGVNGSNGAGPAAAPAAPAVVAEIDSGFKVSSVPAAVWGKILERAVDRILSTPAATVAPPFNPEVLLDLSLRMAERMTPPAPPPPPPAAPAAGLTFDGFIETYDRINKLIERRSVSGTLETAAAVAANGGGIGQSLIAALPDLFTRVVQGIPVIAAQIRASRAPAPPLMYAGAIPPAGVYGPGPGGYPMPAAPNAGAYSMPAAGPEVGGAPPAAAPMAELTPEQKEMNEILQMLSPQVVDKLSALLPKAIERFLDGTPGIEFGRAVAVCEGKPFYRVICSIRPDKLIVALAFAPPELSRHIVGRRDEVLAWLEDFCAFDVDDDDLGEGEDES